MKNFLVLPLLFLFNYLCSQNYTQIDLVWVPKATYIIGQEVYTIPQFNNKFLYFNPDTKILKYQTTFDVSSNITEAEIIEVNYSKIEESDLGDLKKNLIKTTLDFEFIASFARDQKKGHISFNPIIKKSDGFYKVIKLIYGVKAGLLNKNSNNQLNTIQNSVLATGNWRRFYVQKSGVYKLTKTFLASLGIDVNVDPRTIKVFGNGGRMLPLMNNVSYPNDLEENAVLFVGEADGVFNDSDYILFYAEGVDQWNKESLTHVNLFADKSYYYISAGNGNGKRMNNYSEPSGVSTMSFNTYDGYVFHELDLVNPGKIGRRWFGEAFNVTNNQDFNFNLQNYQLGTLINFTANFAAVSNVSTGFSVKVNGTNVTNVNLLPASGSALGYENITNNTFVLNTSNATISLSYNNGGVPSSKGYLDYITMKYNADLKGIGKQYLFSNSNVSTNIGIGDFLISNATNIKYVFDISDIYNVSKIDNNSTQINFKLNLGSDKKFAVVDLNDLYVPSFDASSVVLNQNLKGTIFKDANGNFQDIDYLIVTPSYLSGEAERLAAFHRSNANLKVKVVDLDKIYNEFGGGKQDIAAIRNFVKYVYNNASTSDNKVKYLNLFGDASYDYKDRLANNTNIVPIFHGFYPSQSLSSNNSSNFSLFQSFMSDDFFVMLDDNEGDMIANNDGLDVAVGRMLVSSINGAKEMVDKVYEYHHEKAYGNWRNKLVYYADDPDPFFTGDYSLQVDLNNLADNVTLQNPTFNTKKIYTDSYVQQVSAGGPRYPQAKKDFIDAIKLGALVLNYYGHGNEESFAIERIFEKSDAIALNNKYKYPLFITITCEFTRFDDPARPTGGEYMYWNKFGGAISMLATTRQIGQNVGLNINERVYDNLFERENGSYIAVSEVLRRAKSNVGSTNKRVVFYIGDPALKLAIPKPKVVLTEINDQSISNNTVVMQALSLNKLEGEVVDENDQLISNYNGNVEVQVYDKNIVRTTLDNDNCSVSLNQLPMNFSALGETIFRGNATVTNGKFEISFIVPQDIQIPVGNGRVSLYAKRNTPNLEDQTGYDSTVRIGGVNVAAENDDIPPTVKLYMNDTNFVSGGITNNSPIFLAYLFDEHGINTASGIGHDIVAILDGDENNPYILNEYYQTANNDYKNGNVNYPFRDLAPGLHTILFKAWDVYNNLITAEIQFVVVGNEELELEHVLNYPNPFVNYTEFWFNHNRPFEPLDVQVQILTITGKLVKTINQSVVTNGFMCRDIKWDGRDDFGDKIGKGVYVYKLTVKSTTTGKKTEKIEKLVIL